MYERMVEGTASLFDRSLGDPMDLLSRSTIAVLPALLCLACGSDTDDRNDSRPEISIAPRVTLEPIFAPAGHELRAAAGAFLRTTFVYDARSEGRLDFLADAEPLVTRAELHRLQGSARASLPWQVLAARGERTQLAINGISKTTPPTQTVRLHVWVTVTTLTNFATLHELASVTLTLARTDNGWKVTEAHGAGL